MVNGLQDVVKLISKPIKVSWNYNPSSWLNVSK